jgi:homoserine acetyltransferase
MLLFERYRYPTDLDESITDVIASIKFLEHAGIRSVGLVGHSFGGAAVIKAAIDVPNIVKTVITLSTELRCSRSCISIKTRLLYSTNTWY